jgi:hypothetical protein
MDRNDIFSIHGYSSIDNQLHQKESSKKINSSAPGRFGKNNFLKNCSMKKLVFILVAALCFSCTNSGEGSNKNDSTEPDVNTGTMQDTQTGDTSSYQRMPEMTTDSTGR